MPRRTKIVCTLGPAVNSRQGVKALADAGMNVARINCSHGDWPTRKRWIKWIAEVQRDVSPIAVLIDLSGPKFRIGEIKGQAIELKTGQTVTIAHKGKGDLPVPDAPVWKRIAQNDRILLGDGGAELRATKRKGAAFLCTVVAGGTVKSHQGLTLVGKTIKTPAITEKDKRDLKEALALDADFIALSYVRKAADVKALRKLAPHARIVAKIETPDAMKNIDEIIAVSDAVMVARGDMGLQMDIEEVPVAQKRIIAKCNATGTPVITATQMLESMVFASRPTRAEATDVANAILDGTDALMLSAETATGAHPVEAVRTMDRIASRTERTLHARSAERTRLSDKETDSVACAAVQIAHALRAKAVLTSTTSGTTPRLVSRYRPPMPVYCACWNPQAARRLALVWGVECVHVQLPKGTDQAIARTMDAFIKRRLIKPGDKVVVTAGVPAGVPGKTNLVLVRDV